MQITEEKCEDRSKQKVQDMTQGPVVRLLVFFALPIFLGTVFQQLYNVIDTMIAGHFLGDDALAAMGATTAIYSLVLSMANGMNNGFSIIIATAFGEKNEKKVKDSVGLMLILNFVSAVVITLISVLLIKKVLLLLKTPEDIFEDAFYYIFIILAGLLITICYNMEAAVLRALGNSKTPLVYLIVASILNIIFDYLAVSVLKFGITGLAWATILAQLISVIFCFIHIKKNYPILKLRKENFVVKKDAFWEMFSAGLSMGLMYSIYGIGSVILQGSINALGTLTITAHMAARKVLDIIMLPLGTISTANATFVSQNYGASNMKRVKEGIQKSCLIGMAWSVISVVLTFCFSDVFVEWMTGSNEKYVIHTAGYYLKVNVPFFFPLTILLVLRTALQGIGSKIAPLVSSSLELIGKVIATVTIVPLLGYFGVCVIEPITWIVCMAFLVFVFYKKVKQNS